jgi:hypothetical protein
LPVGAEKWSFKKRVNKLSKMILKSSRLMKRCTPSLPIHMDSWKVTKIADDDKSGVVLVDNLRPYGRK